MYITQPWANFSRSVSPQLEISRRDLSEAVSFGIGTLLVVEQSNLENGPGASDVHRPCLSRWSVHCVTTTPRT